MVETLVIIIVFILGIGAVAFWINSTLSKIREELRILKVESELVKFLMHEKNLVETQFRELQNLYRPKRKDMVNSGSANKGEKA